MLRRSSSSALSPCSSASCGADTFPPDLALYEIRAAALAARKEAARHGLLACVEVHCVSAVGVQVAEERVLPAREREESHRRGHTDVHSHHAGLHIAAVAAHGRCALREDRSAVPEAA